MQRTEKPYVRREPLGGWDAKDFAGGVAGISFKEMVRNREGHPRPESLIPACSLDVETYRL